jgi:hypothetical protein
MPVKSKTIAEQSERLLQIDWRNDPEHDSTRNPAVEASFAIEAEAEALEAEVAAANGTAVATNFAAAVGAPAATNDSALDEDALILQLEAQAPAAPVAAPKALSAPAVSVRIDEVFHQIRAYRAVVENNISENSLLGRSLMAQANAVFNTAFLNLQARFGFIDIYADIPGCDPRPELDDATPFAIGEVLRLQGLIA